MLNVNTHDFLITSKQTSIHQHKEKEREGGRKRGKDKAIQMSVKQLVWNARACALTQKKVNCKKYIMYIEIHWNWTTMSEWEWERDKYVIRIQIESNKFTQTHIHSQTRIPKFNAYMNLTCTICLVVFFLYVHSTQRHEQWKKSMSMKSCSRHDEK